MGLYVECESEIRIVRKPIYTQNVLACVDINWCTCIYEVLDLKFELLSHENIVYVRGLLLSKPYIQIERRMNEKNSLFFSFKSLKQFLDYLKNALFQNLKQDCLIVHKNQHFGDT